MREPFKSNSILRLPALAAAIGLLLAACSTTPSTDDAKELYPIALDRQTVSLALEFTPGATRLEPAEAARLDRFLDGFVDKGSGPLSIAAYSPGPRPPGLRGPVQFLSDHAFGRGVKPSEIRLVVPAESDRRQNRAVLSFSRFDVRLPRCGDWWNNSSFNPRNRVHRNFGCATQRYGHL